MAGPDHSGERGGLRHCGGDAPGRRVETVRVALAGAVHDRRRGRPAARQDAAGTHPAVAQGRHRAGRDLHAGRAAAGRRDPLDGAGAGRGQRAQRQLGAADLAGTRSAPPSVRSFKLSTDPNFATKVEDIVELYVDPPAHAVVLSIDEKSQIQALDRTQPGLPLKKGRAETMTHDYKRNGTTTLFAAFNVLDGTVIGQCMQRHRHQEFLRFLNAVEGAVPAGKVIHVILDNYAAHKHAKVRRWLTRHPRWIFHFTPTSCSWLNAVETLFAKLAKRQLKRGVFPSVVALQQAINGFVAAHNREP